MSELYDTCKAEFIALRESIVAKLADKKLKLRELWQLFRQFSEAAVAIAEQLNVSGPEKRALVIEAALAWWDEELVKIDLWGPDEVIDPKIREAIPLIVGGLVDAVVAFYNWIGWPAKGDV